MESFVQQNLGIYYVILIIFGALSFLCNLKESKRIFQSKIMRYYFVMTVLLFLVSIFERLLQTATDGLNPANYTDSTVQLFITLLILFSKLLTYIVSQYPIVILGILIIGTASKIGMKFKEIFNLLYDQKFKENMISKCFFDKEHKITERGLVFRKVFQNLAYTLLIVYVCMPIFWHFEIELFFSSFVNLFLAITFVEFYFSLNCGFIVPEKDSKNKLIENGEIIFRGSSLKPYLKFSKTEVLHESSKMIASEENIIDDNTSLLCEVANWEQFRDVNMTVMNGAFFENKKVLVICSNMSEATEYYKNLIKLNREYDGKIAVKLLNSDDKLFDNSIDIYVSTLELFFGNAKLINKLDTIIIEDIDSMMQKKLELLRAFGSIVKIQNSSIRYVLITYLKQGIEAAVKNLLLIDKIAHYALDVKQQPDEVELNIWDNKNVEIGDTILGKINHNLGNMLPLSLISVDKDVDRVLVVSQNEPLEFQFNELNSIKSLAEKKIRNDEIKEFNKKVGLRKRLKYYPYRNTNYIVVDDCNYNLYDIIYRLLLINGKKNYINILSKQYLLRDYMIANYEKNKSRMKLFLPYIPYEVDNSKVILHNLILQLTNFGVTEEILLRIFGQNKIEVILNTNSVRTISQSLNKYIAREFSIDIDTYSYVILRETDDNLVFDSIEKSYDANQKIYMLDKEILKLLPNELFKEISFTKDGFILDIEKEYSYNFYQKYLPGQKHCLNNCNYEIKEITEANNDMTAIVETSTNYKTNLYRQRREITNLGDMQVEKSVSHDYENIKVVYTIGKMKFDVNTLGYYEFSNGITVAENDFRYVKLSESNMAKVKRFYTASKVLKIDYSKISNNKGDIEPLFTVDNKYKVAQDLAFILTEVLFSLLGENANYVQVKTVAPKSVTIENMNWIYPIVSSDSNDNIELYIFEDVELERGLVDMIYINLDNIFNIISDYLSWVFDETAGSQRNVFGKDYLMGFAQSDSGMRRFMYVKKLLSETQF